MADEEQRNRDREQQGYRDREQQDYRDREEQDEFYEAMPGTMDRPAVGQQDARDEYADERDQDAARPSLLPWLLIPAALLLGWMLLNALNSNNQNNTGTTGQEQQQNNPAPNAAQDLTQ